jgi:superfamily I DNA/RNA helicase
MLRVNYRTSHQIRTQADRLLGPVVSDVDGNTDNRTDTVSVFNGPPPTIQMLPSEIEEVKAVADWIVGHLNAGLTLHEIGLFVRSKDQLGRAQTTAKQAGVAFKVLDEKVEATSGYISIGTMHLAKGLEFRAVAVMACATKSFPCRNAYRRLAMTPTSRRSTIQSATCCTSPAHALGTTF